MSVLSFPAVQEVAHGFAHLSPLAASLLVASVWRGVLLAIVVALALRMLPRLSAAVRSAIWMSVLLVIVLSPGLPLLFAERHGQAMSTGLLHADPRWSYALLGVWVALSLVRLLQLAVSAFQLRGLARRAVPIAASGNVARVLDAASRRVQLCTSAEVDRPSVAGFIRPCILIPPGLLGRLSESELEQVVLHEMEHLRRRDDWTNLLQKLSLAVLPLHPVVHWLDRRLCLERELACDDGVMRATHAPKSYAACLTNLAEQSLLRRGVSLALGAVGSWKPQSEVARRVLRILSRPEAVMGPTEARFAAGALLAGVLGGAVALAHTPRLISFAPEAPQLEQSASATTAEHLSGFTSGARVIMAKAAMPVPHAAFAKAVVTPRAMAAGLRVASRKPALNGTQQHRFKPTPGSAPLAPMFRLTAWRDTEVPAASFALAVEEDSSFTYAAVPVRGGWLIVQL